MRGSVVGEEEENFESVRLVYNSVMCLVAFFFMAVVSGDLYEAITVRTGSLMKPLGSCRTSC